MGLDAAVLLSMKAHGEKAVIQFRLQENNSAEKMRYIHAPHLLLHYKGRLKWLCEFAFGPVGKP